MRRRPAVVALDDLAGQYRHAAIRDVLEVESGLLILHERAIEGTARTLVACIGRRNSEASSERWLISCNLSSSWLSYRTVETAAALLQILSRPVFRERDGEADSISLAVS